MSGPVDKHVTKPNRKPTFFWQGLLIILPVLALAIMGVFFLRQDKSLVMQQAREDSQRLSDEVARYISSHLETQLRAQDNYATWESNQKSLDARRSLGGTVSTGNKPVEERYHIPLQPYRELIEGYLRSQVRPFFYGPIVSLEGKLIDPPPYDAVPIPQSDGHEVLSALQRELWEAAPERYGNVESFLHLNPPEPFAARAKFSLALLMNTNQPLVAEAILVDLINSSNAMLTASGLPLSSLAALELMRLQATRFTQATETSTLTNLQNSAMLLASNAVRHPSSLSSVLVEEASATGHRFFPDNVGEIERWRYRWTANQLRYPFYEDLNSDGLMRPDKWRSPTAFWTTWQGENRLVSVNPVKAKETDEQICGYELLAASESLAEVAVLEMLDKSRIRLPAYASISFEVCGKTFPKESGKPKEFPYSLSGPWLDLGAAGYIDLLGKTKVEAGVDYSFNLSEAEIPQITNATEVLAQTLENWEVPRGTTEANFIEQGMKLPGFKVQIRLVQPKELFALQQKRVLIFGSLIAFAAAVALVGLFAAHRAFRRQLHLNEMKSNFVSSVSHELRAPLASVRLMAEGLERGKISDPKKQHEYFRFITQECRRLSSLIENVLDFSRIEQGRKEYEFEPTDIARLTSETVKLMEPYAEEKRVLLKCSIAADLAASGPQPSIDGRAIQQALINLIDNAIKHSPNGKLVNVRLEQNPQALSLSVGDYGTGIPLNQQKKIFERFYRLGSELRRETQGVGIGLSIVKHIVEAHGGRIVVRSAPGQGSCFTIELPTENQNENL
ncbi:MAG: Histidine kinase [Verrucomicrobiales bacterium]|nr:Histidine kinase [Verrucomicrobiales bacterium]